MNKQTEKMISADKLLEWLKQNDERLYKDLKHRLNWLDWNEVAPDPIPLPTLKPGDKVKCFGILEYVTVMAVDKDEIVIMDLTGERHTVTPDDLEVVE